MNKKITKTFNHYKILLRLCLLQRNRKADEYIMLIDKMNLHKKKNQSYVENSHFYIFTFRPFVARPTSHTDGQIIYRISRNLYKKKNQTSISKEQPRISRFCICTCGWIQLYFQLILLLIFISCNCTTPFIPINKVYNI